MEIVAEKEENIKQEQNIENALCRCCLSIEKPMINANKLNQYFMDLAGINVLATDGLPQWICYECSALLKKAAKFKYKMLRAQTMLYEYVTRCAPFPIDAQDPELVKYASPHLCSSEILVFDSGKRKLGFYKVLEHEKNQQQSKLDNISLLTTDVSQFEVIEENPENEIVKDEHVASDFEDDVPLQEIRNRAPCEMNELCDDSLLIKEENVVKTDAKIKKRKRDRDEEIELPTKKTIRKAIELDPTKIRVVMLNPEEQFKQREEESKASLKFPYQCHLCYKGFNFESKLENHMTKHNPSRGPYECSLCHMYLPTSYSFSVHSAIHNKRYECMACGRRMIDRASIHHHYRTQHEGITIVITCHLCGKTSSNNKTHRGHMRNHHSGERPKCDHCGKSFVNKDSLTEHMQIHLGVKNYECSICGKRCRTRAQIRHHQLKHSNVKDFYCVECDVRFKTAHSLRQHLQRSLKHKDVDSLKFECASCPRRYESAAALAAHARVQHEGVRAHVCACGRALASRTSLRKHAARHLAGKRQPNHVCHTCGKTFLEKSVLTNHIRTHTGEKPFPCALCGRRFAQLTAMRTHMRRVHMRDTDKQAKVEPAQQPRAPPLCKKTPLGGSAALDFVFY